MSIYVKTPEGWEPLVEGSLEGAPGFPIILNPAGGSVIFFEAGVEGSAGPTVAYGAYITPNDGAIVEVDQETLEVAVSGTKPFTSYRVYVYGVNAAGKGAPSSTNPFHLNYNAATGGTETVVDDYNGTGQKWKIHTFENSGTLSVAAASSTFRYLVVGAGGSGGSTTEGGGGGCGGVVDTAGHLSVGDIAITVGAGQDFPATGEADASAIDGVVVAGGGFQGGSGYGGAGGNSGSPLTFTGAGGSSSSQTCGGGAGASADGSGKDGGFGVTTTIGGSTTNYTSFAGGGGGGNRGKGTGTGASGGGNARNPNGTNATRIGSGGGGSDFDGFGGSGFRGEVVVAYQIGTSTTTQIKNAQAKQAAKSQGHDVGYAEGFSEGYADFEPLPIPDEDTE